MGSLEHKTTESVIAFIDILGAESRISENENKSLQTVHHIYEQALISYKKSYATEQLKILMPRVKIFSDNIVVSVATDILGTYPAFLSVSFFCANIQIQFLSAGYLVRGGISIGGFFQDSIMIWGKGLVRAYQTEECLAIYPRIVVDPEAVRIMKLAENSSLPFYYKQSRDGLFFIDYLNEKMFTEKKRLQMLLLKALDDIDKLITSANGQHRALQKIYWHLSYLTSRIEVISSD